MVQPIPSTFSMFDETGRLTCNDTLSKEVTVQSSDGKGHLFQREQGGIGWKDNEIIQTSVCRVKDAPIGRHSEFWMPRGVKASSISLRTKGNEQKPSVLSFACNVTGEIWHNADREKSERSEDSSDSDDDALVSMYQRGGQCLVSADQHAWEADLTTGIVSAKTTPLLNGVTYISLSTSSTEADKEKVVIDDGSAVCSTVFLCMIVDQYVAWRLDVIKKLGGNGEYVQAECLLHAVPGKSDKVDKSHFSWAATKKIQRACMWREFEKNTLSWLELMSGYTGSSSRQRATTMFTEMGLVSATNARLSTLLLSNAKRAILLAVSYTHLTLPTT